MGTGRYYHAVAVLNGTMYVTGGNSGVFSSSEMYDAAISAWANYM